MKRRLTVAVLSLLLSGCEARSTPPATDPATTPQSLPAVTLKVNGTPLTLQVADDEAKREKGLMYVKAMPADAGMLFVFTTERPLTFWMKDTAIDLDIVFLDHGGRVVAVKTMRAYDQTYVSSEEPCAYAVELNAGAAQRLGLKVGQTLDVPRGIADHVQ